jgi:type VI secretion system protein ImpK
MDETVLSVPGACKDYWISRPLQLDHFGDNLAGEEFFNKLKNLLLQPETKKDVLEVYYLCLSLGYEGKYKISNADERLAIMDDLGRKLRRMKIRASSELSPHGRRLDSEVFRKKGAFLLPLWISGAVCLAAVIVAWAAQYWSNTSRVGALTSSIHSLIVK